VPLLPLLVRGQLEIIKHVPPAHVMHHVRKESMVMVLDVLHVEQMLYDKWVTYKPVQIVRAHVH
tara:strand:+ start:377 stop:568 length:192 start_codon:yes stop_codon:yes gene_type:complete